MTSHCERPRLYPGHRAIGATHCNRSRQIPNGCRADRRSRARRDSVFLLPDGHDRRAHKVWLPLVRTASHTDRPGSLTSPIADARALLETMVPRSLAASATRGHWRGMEGSMQGGMQGASPMRRERAGHAASKARGCSSARQAHLHRREIRDFRPSPPSLRSAP
jgi:hypothetical protein